MYIGKKISELRTAKGLTQKELANLIYVSDKTISKWESLRGNPSIELLPILAKILDTTIDNLFMDIKHEIVKKDSITFSDLIKNNTFIYFVTYSFILILLFIVFLDYSFIIEEKLEKITLSFTGYELLFNFNPNNYLLITSSFIFWLSFMMVSIAVIINTMQLFRPFKIINTIANKSKLILIQIGLILIFTSALIFILTDVVIKQGFYLYIVIYLFCNIITLITYKNFNKRGNL